MKRLCIFCFYDSKGIVDKSVEYLLGELLLNSDRLVIVVNGNIEDNSKKYLKLIAKMWLSERMQDMMQGHTNSRYLNILKLKK